MAESVEEAKLMSALVVELQALETLAAVMPLELKPVQAWFLLGFLQLALRQPGVAGKPKEVMTALARNIEGRITNGRPAMQEMTKRGWAGGETAATWGAPGGPPPPDLTQRPVAHKGTPGRGDAEKAEEPEEKEKRKPEVTPQNKAIAPPENKLVPPKRRKPQ